MGAMQTNAQETLKTERLTQDTQLLIWTCQRATRRLQNSSEPIWNETQEIEKEEEAAGNTKGRLSVYWAAALHNTSMAVI